MTTQGRSRSPTLAELLRSAVDSGLEDVHVAIPGRIEEWDPVEQKASVKPLVKRRVATENGEELIEELPIISDVPVLFPRSKEFFLSFPLAQGDFVLLIFAERSIDKWLSGDGEDTDPNDFRRHDLTDAVAIPGCAPFSKALAEVDPDNAVLGHDNGGVQVHVTADKKVEIKLGGGDASQSAAIAEKLETLYTQAVTGIKAIFEAHVHGTGVGPSTPPSAPNNMMPAWDAAIASTKLKLED